MRWLIFWIFAGRICHFVGFVMRWLIFWISHFIFYFYVPDRSQCMCSREAQRKLNIALYKMSPDLAGLIKEALGPRADIFGEETGNRSKTLEIPGQPGGLETIQERLQGMFVDVVKENCSYNIIGVGERLHKVLGQIDLGTLDSCERSLPFGLLVADTYEPPHKKTCLRGLQPGKTQTGLHSQRSYR